MHEAEQQRAHHADLEAPQDVLLAWSEEHEEAGGGGRYPGVDPGPAHDHAEEDGYGEVKPRRHGLVSEVVEPE